MTMRFTASEVKPLDRVCPTQWPAYKSAHMPRSCAPISMLTADCGAEVLSASTVIGAVIRAKSGSMSSGKTASAGRTCDHFRDDAAGSGKNLIGRNQYVEVPLDVTLAPRILGWLLLLRVGVLERTAACF